MINAELSAAVDRAAFGVPRRTGYRRVSRTPACSGWGQRLVVLTVALIVATSPVQGQETGTLRGTVTLVENGEPVDGDSRFVGFDARGSLRLGGQVWATLGLGYVNATLTTTGEPLPRIPPLRGTLNLTRRLDRWLDGRSHPGRHLPRGGRSVAVSPLDVRQGRVASRHRYLRRQTRPERFATPTAGAGQAAETESRCPPL